MVELPIGLRHALETNNCVLFLGAGVGKHLLNSEGNCAPTGKDLSLELADIFLPDFAAGNDPKLEDLATVSKLVEIRKGRSELEAFIRERLNDLQPDDTFKWLFTRRWRAIFTTNYDNGIQRAYEQIPNPPQNPVLITTTTDLVSHDPRFEVPVYFLHGSLFTSSRPQIVITESDYAQFREKRRMIFELFKRELAISTILYIGYSNRDSNWRLVLSEMAAELVPVALPTAYRVDPATSEMDKEILQAQNITTIDATLSEFVEVAQAILNETQFEPERIQKLRQEVPASLRPAFDQNSAAVVRLLASWEYVNEAPFDAPRNTQDFLRGDRPNWSLIGAREFFERDIEEELMEALLDYATSNRKRVSTKLLLASAGYGVSTLLMTLAGNLVKERAGTVLMLKPGQNVLEGDIEYACSILQHPIFFFIDNAADHVSQLNNSISQLRNSGYAALFFLGERLNEWRQSRANLRVNEYALGPLSDAEVDRLIDYLSKHSALNALEPLSQPRRIQAIRQKHGKDLLVVMRESTEGKSFDAILEDEYHGIRDELSRQLYLTVCCFHQYGVYLRDGLLADLLELPLTELYTRTEDAIEGVVIYEPLNLSRGLYGARARHRVIAAVVWQRCGSSAERVRILQDSLNRLNLNYSADKDAFDHFVRADRLIDEIHTLDGKIRFFDRACQKDPLSAYVRQHYARMLLRAGFAEMALDQIEKAIEIDRTIRVLYHTKGHILSQLALENSSPEIARRRMAQGEDSFRQGLRINQKDEYCYHGLASLYFGWAKRSSDTSEQTLFISKAEETISEGLRKANIRDGLWIVSADIHHWLENEDARILALEKAVRETPNSVIARYLLARAYRKRGNSEKALEVIEPVVKQDLNEVRAMVECALNMILVGKSYAEAIAVLNLSTLYGFSDPRFIATLGGMYFMNREYTKAQEVFNRSYNNNFTSYELNTVQFRPFDPNNRSQTLRLVGQVADVRAGYAFIDVAEYPRLFCPSTKFGGLIMSRGLRVSVEIGFRPKGVIAETPRKVE